MWLDRPPYLRWALAAVLVTAAAWMELGPAPTTHVWFAVDPIPAGTPLPDAHLERRAVATDHITGVEPVGVAATDIEPGDPLVASMTTTTPVPSGWLAVTAPVPPDTAPGTEAALVLLSTSGIPQGDPVRAVVIGGADAGGFGGGDGTVAVPPDRLSEVVAAAAGDRLVVAVSTDPIGPGRTDEVSEPIGSNHTRR